MEYTLMHFYGNDMRMKMNMYTNTQTHIYIQMICCRSWDIVDLLLPYQIASDPKDSISNK